MNYGKKANHVRYIKQVTDEKGKLTKASMVVKPRQSDTYIIAKMVIDQLQKQLKVRNLIIIALSVALAISLLRHTA